MIVAKQGEYGAALVTRESFFALPAYPLETVIDPTGAGDTFAGGLVGYIAAHPEEALSDELLRRAMAHATVLASFNVEEFGTERVAAADGARRSARASSELHSMTQFSGAPPGADAPGRGRGERGRTAVLRAFSGRPDP